MQTKQIKIDGMTCMGCVNSVKAVLEKISGVSQADVSLEQAQATIQYDASVTSETQLKRVIEEAGFDVID